MVVAARPRTLQPRPHPRPHRQRCVDQLAAIGLQRPLQWLQLNKLLRMPKLLKLQRLPKLRKTLERSKLKQRRMLQPRRPLSV